MVDTEVVAGLAIGYFGSQFLGNFVENKVKPDILATSTSEDKMIAGVSNDGSKIALAYGAYSVGKTSTFLRNVAWGSVLGAVIDAGWRYSHEGVPYGYKPFNIPLLGDLNEIITGPNANITERTMTMDACSDARAAADRACSKSVPIPAPAPAPAPIKVPIPAPVSPISDSERKFREGMIEQYKKQDQCRAIKTDATTKRRQYTKAEKDMCGTLLCKQVIGGRCVPPLYGLNMSEVDEIEDILITGYELLAAPPLSPAKKRVICDSIKADAITKNRPYTAQEIEMCTGFLEGSGYREYNGLQGYTSPVPGTSPGDITHSPSEDIAAPVEDEYPVSTIPDRKSRFAFMEEKNAKQFGFNLGSPISGREKYFGMKT